MIFTSDEKLMLFLIWTYSTGCDLVTDYMERDWEEATYVFAMGIHHRFQQFLSEAYEFKEGFEFYVSDDAIELIKGSQNFRGVALVREKNGTQNKKIKITVED